MMHPRLGRRSVLAALLATGVGAIPALARTPERKPNVVLILADDIGAECLNTYGGEYYTPRLDGMAREGQVFQNAHATPICTPTRVRLMTGREGARNYKAFGYLDPAERTFAHMFKAAGYTTGIVGKWQLSGNGYDGLKGATPQSAGFDTSFLWQEKSLDEKGSRYWGPTLSTNGRNKIYETGFGPELQGEAALAFIEANKANPFLLYYPMTLPHGPFVATPDSPSGVTDKSRFAGMVSYMDKLVGDVFDKLDALGLAKDTLVIFAGDNGTARAITSYRDGQEVQGGKGRPGVTGTNVPLIVRWPDKLAAGQVREGLFDVMDVLPTLADLCGLAAPSTKVDGVSQAGVLRGERQSARDWIFMHYAPVWVMQPARFIFDTKWKLYGDGRFMAIDARNSSETPVGDVAAGSPAAIRRAEFQKLLDGMGDGPLNQDRYPMCIGQPSLDPAKPAIRAGCEAISGGSLE